MQIDRLGALDGPVLLFGGPYSNLQATQAMRQEAERRGIPADHCICTGDVVAYCADAAETVAEIRDWGCVVIAGNCEKQLSSGAGDCGCGFEDGTACDLLSAGWFAHADQEIEAEDRAWMAGLPDWVHFTHHGLDGFVCHGAASDISRFLWSTSPDLEFSVEANLFSLENWGARPDLVIAGHSGIPFIRTLERTTWVNAGAIGMPPHDGRPATRFAVLQDGTATLHALEYDWHSAYAAMEAKGLTQGYHRALETGWWPSEDVLPQSLRRSFSPDNG